ncbi:MAG: hypothetical protein EOO09_15065 [Chitinophagaceae bacterium]|nr:MAG: hypothetical protein EOO09_15065 [Chitinophagaceae bacterium]
MLALLAIAFTVIITSFRGDISMQILHSQNIDSLGACQGVANHNGRIFLYGDRETGMIREYKMDGDSLAYQHREIKLTLNDTDVINHPTGIAYNGEPTVFIGNSIRLNKEGTLWRAAIHAVNWTGLQQTGTLDGNMINTIEDDACIQGTRPEYVKYKGKWYVATADYGPAKNEVRLYDPARLLKAKKTSDKGVLVKKFACSPWVQNIHWIEDKGILVLVQNQVEGRRWRFTYLDFEKSMAGGKEHVLKVVDIDRADELEGFAFLGDGSKGVAVSSSRRNNANITNTAW